MANLQDVSSFKDGEDITPSDEDTIEPTRGLYVTGAGDIAIQFVDGRTLTKTVAANTYHPLCVKKVLATGTTATGIQAHW